MLKNRFFVIILLIYFFQCTVNDTGVSLYPSESEMIEYVTSESEMTEIEGGLLSLFNEYRSNLDLNKLTTDVLCRNLSEEHNIYMITNNEVSHDNSFVRRYEVLRRGGKIYGEIVGKNYSVAKTFFNAFIMSEEHNKIIIDERFTHIGIRFTKNDDGKYYVTCIFTEFL